MNIVFLDHATMGAVSLAPIEALGALTVYDNTANAQAIERCKKAEVIICNKVRMSKEVMDALPKLRLICIAATGMNNVDLEYAAAKNILVKNVANYSTASVAQVTFALLLPLMHNICYLDSFVKSGNYAHAAMFTHHGHAFFELSGKQLGIIGMGNIGKRVAGIAEAFGAQVAYYSTTGKNHSAAYPSLSLNELLQTSDVISIHAPLNDSTNNLIAYPQLQLMKPSAYLVNIGRGRIVNEPDLARALNENLIAGAALDVFVNEPIHTDNPLLHINNKEKLIMTPHIGWASVEARRRLVDKIAENIRTYASSR
ncbi:MAG: D-2-hydroxyacid dehydrogenase [Prevotellaceae bacterium]|jgi:glycerate dehydrogenase|nr:D-2-hydroxyacid dehydrogenase [Prevotellaceae bacterium]